MQFLNILFPGLPLQKKRMTYSYFYNKRLDYILMMFVQTGGGGISKDKLFDNAPDEFDTALSFLVAEGCLEESKYGFQITYKGKAIINQGGFVGKHRRECALFYSSIIGTAVGVIALVVSIVALLC